MSTRPALTLITALALAGSVLVGIPEANATAAAPSPSQVTSSASPFGHQVVAHARDRRSPKRRAERGFVVDARLSQFPAGVTPVLLHSPARGELWAAARDADGKVVMLQRRGNSWRVHRLDVAYKDVALDGVGSRNVWITASGKLLRFDGRRWRDAGEPGVVYTNVASARQGGIFYAARRTEIPTDWTNWTGWAESWLGWTDGRGRHEDFGHARVVDPTPSMLNRIRQVGDRIFGEWQHSYNGDYSFVYELVNGAWVEKFQLSSYYRSNREYQHTTADVWLVLGGGTHVVMGQYVHSAFDLSERRCLTVNDTTAQRCEAPFHGGAGDLRDDGRAVIGAGSYTESGVLQPASFGYFDQATGWTPIAGAAHSRTISITVEPRSDVTWALTSTGETLQIQVFRG